MKNNNEEKKKGRQIKLTAEDVLEKFEEEERYTVAELAEAFGCHVRTVRRRIRELRKAGKCIAHDNSGSFLIDSVDDEKSLLEFKRYFKWLKSSLVACAVQGMSAKPLLIEAKKQALELMTKEERRLLATDATLLLRICDFIDIESEI